MIFTSAALEQNGESSVVNQGSSDKSGSELKTHCYLVAKEVSVLAVKDNHCYQFPVMIASCITVGTMNRMANERAQAEGMNHRVGNPPPPYCLFCNSICTGAGSRRYL